MLKQERNRAPMRGDLTHGVGLLEAHSGEALLDPQFVLEVWCETSANGAEKSFRVFSHTRRIFLIIPNLASRCSWMTFDH
ncbi:hypothetical protein [Pyxidicoccus caerfyrddinensis]|uniref:hypothetical protein n=1 Tax=Pyxidicoccus caerfyrddinensis TaxID=2709663 RepID=UPI0013D92862|nr:hypothetical protein [Pyxidicoccus caerfyrddinensis]